MKERTVTSDVLNMSLRQLKPTEIHEIDSAMHIVKFNLENGITVSYVYNITMENKYYLQRMQPYAIPHGKFSDENEIVEFIRDDIVKFRNAAKSSNFDRFTKVAGSISDLTEQFENMFIDHNIDPADMDLIETKLEALIDEIKTVKDRSETLVY
ncbi:MAG: hypothetical protein SOY83_02955 [Anaerovoracaceae bacterium]|nr:hypothetical protein [Bacillota bacterium]MDY3954426.1 hypothetical protein [Anaerovoracaceae bacterium]